MRAFYAPQGIDRLLEAEPPFGRACAARLPSFGLGYAALPLQWHCSELAGFLCVLSLSSIKADDILYELDVQREETCRHVGEPRGPGTCTVS